METKLAAPVLPFLPPRSADVDRAAATGGAAGATAIPALLAALARFTRPLSYVGLPSLTLPIAFASGLPIGMQFVGRPFAEDAILSAGIAFERPAGFGKRRLPVLPAPTPALTL